MSTTPQKRERWFDRCYSSVQRSTNIRKTTSKLRITRRYLSCPAIFWVCQHMLLFRKVCTHDIYFITSYIPPRLGVASIMKWVIVVLCLSVRLCGIMKYIYYVIRHWSGLFWVSVSTRTLLRHQLYRVDQQTRGPLARGVGSKWLYSSKCCPLSICNRLVDWLVSYLCQTESSLMNNTSKKGTNLTGRSVTIW